MKLVRSIASKILGALGVAEIIGLSRFALKEYGWILSAKTANPVDANGDPLPWITYPAIDILKSRVNKKLRIFEYGCGNSTLWWSEHAGIVRSVEHDQIWFDKMKPLLPKNVELDFVPLEFGGAYSRTSQARGPHDIIVVDGRDRVNCIKNSIAALSDAGVIVLDNSDRQEYQEAIRFLANQGFKQLPLRGLAPMIYSVSETSLFYRPDNVLGL
jgi:hypothetical protein